MGSSAEAVFEKLLVADEPNIDEVRKHSWTGIPDRLRSEVWKLLIGYAPLKCDKRAAFLKKKREEYFNARSRNYGSDASNSSIGRSEEESRMLRDILVDVPRTMPDRPLFHADKVQRCIERILFTWALRHPASGYVQGMNDLVTPFFVSFLAGRISDGDIDATNTVDIDHVPDSLLEEVEADSYWCLTKLLDTIQDHYTCAQPGLQRMVFKLKGIVQRIDSPLYNHLQDQGVDFMHISFRWMQCLLLREVELSLAVRIWDTLLAEDGLGFENFHVYVCAALLTNWSQKLQQFNAQELFTFFNQKLPTHGWGSEKVSELMAMAYLLKEMFNESPSHLM